LKLWGGLILRAGITWGIVGVILAILGAALGPILPEVDGLRLGTYALLFAGVHYSARARSDFLQSALGGGFSGIIAAIVLLLIRFVPIGLPTPPGSPTDLLAALVIGFIAGVAGGLGYEVIDR
jgi:hypothetical protein